MKLSEHLEIVKERDRLIDLLILSHMKTLGTELNLNKSENFREMKCRILDLSALSYLTDSKHTYELNHILQSNASELDKLDAVLDEKRPKEIRKMLIQWTRLLRHKMLKEI